ncbi:MAG: threonine-phosphate decarboxylase [Rhizobiaceae bacterium]|nr:threonine-phosphate decarboxylase [Rhizobiaceae bacterium]
MHGTKGMTDIAHGGRLDEAVAQFGGERDRWVDLSTGINPHAYPVPEIAETAWTDLPDQNAMEQTREAVRLCYGVDETAGISLAPGSQMHIQTLPYLYKPQPIAIVGFTYQEHGVCWQRAGHEVYMTDGLNSAEATARIVIVVNPNNPDGRVFERNELSLLARRLAAKGGLLVVDESFADVLPEHSIAEEAGRDGLFVMRSLGKFFGLAGVRFGVGLTTPAIATRLDERLGPWAVSGPALAIADKAMRDQTWQKRNFRKLTNAREKLAAVLEKHAIEVLGGTLLFALIRHDKAEELWAHLANAHILTRPFPGKTDWLRVGLPNGRSQFNKLDKALARF